MLQFKPELGILLIFDNNTTEDMFKRIDDYIRDVHRITIDKVEYRLYVGDSLKSRLDSKRLWSFYQLSTDKCLYGNIAIEALDPAGNPRDITAEDILRIKSHIVIRNKGYMIYIE